MTRLVIFVLLLAAVMAAPPLEDLLHPELQHTHPLTRTRQLLEQAEAEGHASMQLDHDHEEEEEEEEASTTLPLEDPEDMDGEMEASQEPDEKQDMEHDGDVEVFQELSDNGTLLAQMLERYDHRVFDLLGAGFRNLGDQSSFLSPRARYLATLPRQHRTGGAMEGDSQNSLQPGVHEKSDRVLAGFQAVDVFKNLRQLSDATPTSLEECETSRTSLLGQLQELAFNTSVLEVRLELLEMAQQRAERQAQHMVLDYIECHKRQSVLDYVRNVTERSLARVNHTAAQLREEAFECKLDKNKLEDRMETLEGRHEEAHAQYRSTKKSLEEEQRRVLQAEAEATVLRDELEKRRIEKQEAEVKFQKLRENLMDMQRGSNHSEEHANLQLDTLETLNDLLVTQMDILTEESQAAKENHVSSLEALQENLDRCEQGKKIAEDKVQYSGELCANSRIDAAMNFNSTTLYLFKGRYLWVLTEGEGILDGTPRLINETWTDGPSSVDAAFYSDDHESAFLFQGKQYWQYKNFQLVNGFPKLISDGFPGMPSDSIDAAFVWRITGRVYLFKDDRYWQSESNGIFTKHARWGGARSHKEIPTKLDAIFEMGGNTIFVKKDLYYRYSDSSHKVEESLPPYPRLTCTWLFGCPASSACAKRRRI